MRGGGACPLCARALLLGVVPLALRGTFTSAWRAALATWECPNSRQAATRDSVVVYSLFQRLDFVAMAKPQTPELKVYMDKRLNVKLNAERSVTGRLRGFDHFMNLVLDEAVEETKGAERIEIGLIVIRGNSVVQIECLDRVER